LFDRDNSGTINIQEFGQLFNFINQWTEVYRRYDQDNSGTIDENEMNIDMGLLKFANVVVVIPLAVRPISCYSQRKASADSCRALRKCMLCCWYMWM
ncbi:hypothetical protein SK128_022357, partial [Halocaridina rubra]